MFLELELRESASNHQLNPKGLPKLACYLIGMFIAVFCAALILTILGSGKAAPELALLAIDRLNESGVVNPVTAVLLNFRSYDTLLEIAVLLIVAITVRPVYATSHQNNFPTTPWITQQQQDPINPVLTGLLKWLIPLAIVIGGYLLWTGAYEPGGAFQAGAVIASAGVAISLAGQHRFIWHSNAISWLFTAGLLVFTATAGISALVTGTVLEYPNHLAGQLILIIELAATASIAAILLLLFSNLKTMAQRTLKGKPALDDKTPKEHNA